jgi:hypothetical protein
MRRSILGLALVATSLVGCGGGYGYYYAGTPPPPLRAEVIGVAPGPGYVWINGYWGSRGGRYAWVPGYYARPPHRGAHWEEPRWERHGDRYRFHEGRWR